MSREPVVSSHHDADAALSDDELDGVVGGRGTRTCSHGQSAAHTYFDPPGQTVTTKNCPGPDDVTMY